MWSALCIVSRHLDHVNGPIHSDSFKSAWEIALYPLLNTEYNWMLIENIKKSIVFSFISAFPDPDQWNHCQ